MARVSTIRVYMGMFTVLALMSTVSTQDSTQTDIDNIAQYLQIKVYVHANHLSKGTYKIAYHLTNTGSTKIMHTKDWEIIFSLHDKNLLTRPEFEIHGFLIKPYKANLYKMTSTQKGRQFAGLAPKGFGKITIEAKGLSVFKQDIHPRFIARSSSTIPRTIQSTDDDDLGFVFLSNDPNAKDDMSQMTPVRRMMNPDVRDIGRVPESTIIIPPPRAVNIAPNMPLLTLGSITLFHVLADNNISADFKRYFQDVFTTIPTVRSNMIRFVDVEPAGDVDKIYINKIVNDGSKTDDYYRLEIRTRSPPTRNFNMIRLKAVSEKGLHHAVESMMAAAGLYDILPEMTIEDDARFGYRALSLDLTKHFFPLITLKKTLRLMSMYKLNTLELVLGDNYGWRLEIQEMPMLTRYASRRCLSKHDNDCLLPYLGDGADGERRSPNGPDFLTLADFAELIVFAKTLNIDIIPRFNFLGGLLPAKTASEFRYNRLKNRQPTEAKRLYLKSKLPNIVKNRLSEESNSVEGLLDPCINQTFNFINVVLRQVSGVYRSSGVKLTAIHAGGDELTQFLGEFPSCKTTSIQSTADALRFMIGTLQNTLATINAQLHVDQEAIIDPDTKDCLTIPTGSDMRQNDLVTHFHKTFPGSPEDWALSKEQFAYMDGDIAAYPDETNPNAQPDPFIPYNGTKKGLMPWILPYRCANRGYKIVLKPENFFSLDQAYELDFNEPGNRKMRAFHIINMHRMMMYEPLNHYMNMDVGKDGYTFLTYRMCKLYTCETLTRPENVIGLLASIDTTVIRNEAMLWHMMLPRMLSFAERAWREGEHENIVKAEFPLSWTNENIARRGNSFRIEMLHIMNNLAYKELGRLEETGFPFRIPTPAASIQFGIAFNVRPPYPIMVKSDIPGLEIEYRDLTATNPTWRQLFTMDTNNGRWMGGYTFDFPTSNQKIEIRMKSPGGRDGVGTAGRSITMTGNTNNYLPREVPVDIREGTCLPIEDAWTTDIDKITSPQWTRLLQNVDVVDSERIDFMNGRLRNLGEVVTAHNLGSRVRAVDLDSVFIRIQDAMANGNMSTFPATNILKMVYDRDMSIYEARAITVENRFQLWQQEYLKCKVGQAQVKVLPNHPVTQILLGGPISLEQTGMTGGTAGGGNFGQHGGATVIGQQRREMGLSAGQVTGGSMAGQMVGQGIDAQMAGMEAMIGVTGQIRGAGTGQARGSQRAGQGRLNMIGATAHMTGGRARNTGHISRQTGR